MVVPLHTHARAEVLSADQPKTLVRAEHIAGIGRVAMKQLLGLRPGECGRQREAKP